MRARAHAGGAARNLVGVGFQVGDQFLEVLGRDLVGGHDQKRVGRQQGDRREVVLQVVVQVLVDGAVHHIGAEVTDADRVAVRRGAGELAHRDGSRRAGNVVDDELLPEFAAHAFAHDAGHDVGRAAGREGHDEADRLVGIGLGVRRPGRRYGQQGKCGSAQHEEFSLSLLLAETSRAEPSAPLQQGEILEDAGAGAERVLRRRRGRSRVGRRHCAGASAVIVTSTARLATCCPSCAETDSTVASRTAFS